MHSQSWKSSTNPLELKTSEYTTDPNRVKQNARTGPNRVKQNASKKQSIYLRVPPCLTKCQYKAHYLPNTEQNNKQLPKTSKFECGHRVVKMVLST